VKPREARQPAFPAGWQTRRPAPTRTPTPSPPFVTAPPSTDLSEDGPTFAPPPRFQNGLTGVEMHVTCAGRSCAVNMTTHGVFPAFSFQLAEVLPEAPLTVLF